MSTALTTYATSLAIEKATARHNLTVQQSRALEDALMGSTISASYALSNLKYMTPEELVVCLDLRTEFEFDKGQPPSIQFLHEVASQSGYPTDGSAGPLDLAALLEGLNEGWGYYGKTLRLRDKAERGGDWDDYGDESAS
ncbi:MAG: hypothetical protein LBQ02_04275 [Candidatus Nomurabacteria bacterium]|jgi:hypothetical protein|nr:hypothetical protein [Candidatus Nomurabacteria bacterium]